MLPAVAGRFCSVAEPLRPLPPRHPRMVEPTDRAASFAAGVKILVIGKFSLELGAATPIIKPETVPHDEHWRFILSTGGHF